MENTVLHVLDFMDVLLFFQGCVKDHRLWVNSSKDEPPYPLIGEPTRTWPNLVLTLKLLLKPLWICTAGINFFFFLLGSTKYKSSCLFPSSQDTLRKEVSQSVGSHSWGHWCANISTKRFTSGSVSAQLVFCHQGVSVKLSYCNLFCSVVEASNSKWLSFKIPPESPTSWLIAAKHEFAPNFCQISSPTTRLYRGFASNAPVLQMSEPWFFLSLRPRVPLQHQDEPHSRWREQCRRPGRGDGQGSDQSHRPSRGAAAGPVSPTRHPVSVHSQTQQVYPGAGATYW